MKLEFMANDGGKGWLLWTKQRQILVYATWGNYALHVGAVAFRKPLFSVIL